MTSIGRCSRQDTLRFSRPRFKCGEIWETCIRLGDSALLFITPIAAAPLSAQEKLKGVRHYKGFQQRLLCLGRLKTEYLEAERSFIRF